MEAYREQGCREAKVHPSRTDSKSLDQEGVRAMVIRILQDATYSGFQINIWQVKPVSARPSRYLALTPPSPGLRGE